MKFGALITAAGKSRRMEKGNKLLLNLYGKPVLFWSLSPFQNCDLIEEIIITAPSREINLYENLVKKFNLNKVKKIIPGGASRQISVWKALNNLKEINYVLIHDGARPLITQREILKLIKAVKKVKSVILAIPVKDTVKELNSKKVIKHTLNREKIYLAQTPQVFDFNLIYQAYQEAFKKKLKSTDDASLVEFLGNKVSILEGSIENIKITYPLDLDFANLIFSRRALKKNV
ncbi:MAG: 2-C-methyl-D-erythritol 4-phosphate cytidylyltransferase [Armatimonadetes bacterium]|nr:2-C-methyl-D-erythritol 4-phosphate cytidylyltransferase [Armatimonadota bacterium]